MEGSESGDEDDDYPKRKGSSELAGIRTDSEALNQGRSREVAPDDGANAKGAHKDPPRLLIISSKVKLASAIANAALPNVTCVQYKFETCTLDGILASVAQSLGNEQQVESMALVLNCSGPIIYLCGKEEKAITKEGILESKSIREFLSTLVMNHVDRSWVNARLDFLMCSAAVTIDGGIIAKEIEAMVGVPVGISKDLYGTDIPYQRVGDETGESLTIGQLYFRIEKLRAWSGSHPQSLAGFEKIRLVGKGAYGTAVLYRKKDDDTLVILKEINMHDLNASERQMALNEVKVLAMLEHPNIIGYYDSFEEDGVLMIEMEYADGGTLAQFLSAREQPLEERQILEKFTQIVNALKHIHGHNVLHRDLKTANIFLTKDGIVKLGDFGISKMMTTGGKGANTVLGTPYYISPEICEGKAYGDKSDIWALGCILYELACLQKTFEGSNLPALVNKIVNGQFAPIKGNYSNEFKELVQRMLDKEPDRRPSAVELYNKWLPPLLARYEVVDLGDSAGAKLLGNGKSRRMMSAVYYLETYNMSLHPIEMPTKIKIKEISVSLSHAVVVTTEHMVYSWGDGGKGQLGHGDFEPRNTPHLVEALKGKSITKACCGDRFSAFSCNNGIAMTCGDGSKGCLGHGDWQTLTKPKLVESLLHMDVVSLACGLQHVVAVGNKGVVYAWGKGADGRLGTGTEDDQSTPVKVAMPDDIFVTRAFCGLDGTMLVTDIGAIWAFGNNRHNKLGLNNRQGFLAAFKNAFSKTEVEGAKAPAAVRDLSRHKIIDISMGASHTAVVAENGNVYALGRNIEGQLGTGNTKEFNGLNHVKSLEKVRAVKVRCSDLYTAVTTADGQLLFWGTKYNSVPSLDSSWGERVKGHMICSAAGPLPVGGMETAANHNGSMEALDAAARDTAKPGPNGAKSHALTIQSSQTISSRGASPATLSVMDDSTDTSTVVVASPALDIRLDGDVSRGGSSPLSPEQHPQAASKKSIDDASASRIVRPVSAAPKRNSGGTGAAKDKAAEKSDKGQVSAGEDCTAYFQPTPLLHMDSERSESVVLSDFYCHGENVLVLVETTAPPAVGRKLRKRKSLQSVVKDANTADPASSLTTQDSGQHETSSGASEMDTLGTVASWIKRELSDSEVVRPHNFEAKAGPPITRTIQPMARASVLLSDDDIESVEGVSSDNSEETDSEVVNDADNRWAVTYHEQHTNGMSLQNSKLDDHRYIKAEQYDAIEGGLKSKSTSVANQVSASRPSDGTMQSLSASGIRTIDELSSTYSGSPVHSVHRDTSASTADRHQGTGHMITRMQKDGSAAQPANTIVVVPKSSQRSPQQRRYHSLSSSGREGDSERHADLERHGSGTHPALSDDRVQMLMDQLIEEKRHREQSMKEAEERHREREHQIRAESQRLNAERERSMQEEIKKLREELALQHQQMQENFKAVVLLQQQLMRASSSHLDVQSQTLAASPVGQQKQGQPQEAKSKICSLQ